MSNPTPTLPVMNTHIEGTPALVALAITRLARLGAVILPADVHYQGSGYRAIETNLEDGIPELCREIDDAAHKAKTGARLLWGYVGPMTLSVRLPTRNAQRFIETLTTSGYLVDGVQLSPNWTTFRTNTDSRTLNKLNVVLEAEANVNQLPGRFGTR